MSEYIFIFEWLCGGGLWLDKDRPENQSQLVDQGQEMLLAVARDFVDVGFDVVTTFDTRLDAPTNDCKLKISPVAQPERVRQTINDLAKRARWTIAISPETGGRLMQCLDWFSPYRSRLLNPTRKFSRIAGNKQTLMDHLGNCKIPVPRGAMLDKDLDICQYQNPVIKPNDGCGGTGVELIDSASDLSQFGDGQFRIEEFVTGTPLSVSVIGGNRPVTLPPLRQEFKNTPVGYFSRCVNDLDGEIATRATELARRTVDAMPASHGFYGIDMVIGETDTVIEINPRITMSYRLLQQILDFNMADRMISNAAPWCRNS